MNQNSHQRSERRKYTRAKFNETVTVHSVTESKSGNVFEVQGSPLVLRALDVSEGGMRLEISDPASPAKIFKLNFKISSKNDPVDVYSKVAWNTDGSCGLQFIVLDEEVRKQIRVYIEK